MAESRAATGQSYPVEILNTDLDHLLGLAYSTLGVSDLNVADFELLARVHRAWDEAESARAEVSLSDGPATTLRPTRK